MSIFLTILVMLLLVGIVTAVMAHSHSLTVATLHEHIKTMEAKLSASADSGMKDMRQYVANEVLLVKLHLKAHSKAIAALSTPTAPPLPVIDPTSIPVAQHPV